MGGILHFLEKNSANFGKVYISDYNFFGKVYFFVAIFTEKCIFADEKIIGKVYVKKKSSNRNR
jgi:hypothetical protein